MSEPPEQEQEDEPEDSAAAAAADLEELLEQFREPEEPRRKGANPLWLISAFLLSVLACWLALRASGGEAEVEAKSVALTGAMLPGKTSERVPRDEGPVDVVEDYLARCKKGMTAQEVRWIVEDFQRAGLDWEGELVTELKQIAELMGREGRQAPRPQEREKIESLAKQLGQRQRKWFGDTLVAALNLDIGQQREMRRNLAAALEKDWVESLRAREEEEAQEAEGQFNYSGQSHYAALIETWVEKPEYAPWKLSSLTEAQLSLTSFESPDDAVVWLKKPSRPEPLGSPELEELQRRGTAVEGTPFFSLNTLDAAMRMHPAHLRMHLLRNSTSRPLLEELEKRGK